MIDKETLIYDLEMAAADKNLTLQDVINLVNQQREQFVWTNADCIPINYGYILLSFENSPTLAIGRCEVDENGIGEYYIGDDIEPCSSKGLIVNAWMPLPETYKEWSKIGLEG